jgi:hypothetical protein
MSWREAFTALAAISVTGVTTMDDLDDLPGGLRAADLPALLPAFAEQGQRLGEREEGFSALTLDGGAWTSSLAVDHLLIWAPCGAGGGMREALPGLVAAIDDYLTAVGADPWLGGALDAPLAILRIMPGVIDWGGTLYHGVTFRHRWSRTIRMEA